MLVKILDYSRNVGYISIFLLLGYILNPLNYGFLFGYLLILAIALKMDFLSKNLDLDFLILFIFGLCYGLFYRFTPGAGIQFTFVYILTPPFLYLWGKYVTSKTKNDTDLFYVILIVGLLFSLPSLVSVLLNINQGGFVQGTRNIPMFWSSEIKNATGMAAPFILNMCIPAILISRFKKFTLLQKLFLLLIFVLTTVCVLRLGSRTQLLITLITFLITLLYVLPKQTFKQNVSLFAILSVGVFFVFKNVSFDLDADWLTSFAGRMEKGGADIASGGGRTDRWEKSFINLFEKPLGWDVKEFGYSHNLWFDVLRVGGVISFFLLIIFTLKSTYKVYLLLKLKPLKFSLNVQIFTYFLAFHLLFMVEPIIDGSFAIFVLFCFFMGILNKYFSLSTSKVQIS